MNSIKMHTPLDQQKVKRLRAGDRVLLSGKVYTARDAAHKRLCQGLAQGQDPPFALGGSVIYYVGPAPAPPGQAIGSAGPTTSGRMDAYAPMLYSLGVMATIGKGRRSEAVLQALKDNGAVYLGATGGAGALLSKRIRSARVIAYQDLGPEAVRELIVEDFPVLVINDCLGNELYATPNRAAANQHQDQTETG